MSEGVASTCTSALPTWREGIAGRLSFLNHSQKETFVLILLVTYMRPSELSDVDKEGSCPSACVNYLL